MDHRCPSLGYAQVAPVDWLSWGAVSQVEIRRGSKYNSKGWAVTDMGMCATMSSHELQYQSPPCDLGFLKPTPLLGTF
jgi:hypothetical protein